MRHPTHNSTLLSVPNVVRKVLAASIAALTVVTCWALEISADETLKEPVLYPVRISDGSHVEPASATVAAPPQRSSRRRRPRLTQPPTGGEQPAGEIRTDAKKPAAPPRELVQQPAAKQLAEPKTPIFGWVERPKSASTKPGGSSRRSHAASEVHPQAPPPGKPRQRLPERSPQLADEPPLNDSRTVARMLDAPQNMLRGPASRRNGLRATPLPNTELAQETQPQPAPEGVTEPEPEPITLLEPEPVSELDPKPSPGFDAVAAPESNPLPEAEFNPVPEQKPQLAQPQLAQPQLAQPQLAQPQLAQPQLAQPQPQPQLAQPQPPLAEPYEVMFARRTQRLFTILGIQAPAELPSQPTALAAPESTAGIGQPQIFDNGDQGMKPLQMINTSPVAKGSPVPAAGPTGTDTPATDSPTSAPPQYVVGDGPETVHDDQRKAGSLFNDLVDSGQLRSPRVEPPPQRRADVFPPRRTFDRSAGAPFDRGSDLTQSPIDRHPSTGHLLSPSPMPGQLVAPTVARLERRVSEMDKLQQHDSKLVTIDLPEAVALAAPPTMMAPARFEPQREQPPAVDPTSKLYASRKRRRAGAFPVASDELLAAAIKNSTQNNLKQYVRKGAPPREARLPAKTAARQPIVTQLSGTQLGGTQLGGTSAQGANKPSAVLERPKLMTIGSDNPVLDATPKATSAGRPHARPAAILSSNKGPKSELRLATRTSYPLRLQRPIQRIWVANRAICDAMQFDPYQVTLIARNAGQTDVAIWFEGQQQPQTYHVLVNSTGAERPDVAAEYDKLQERIDELFPDSVVTLLADRDRLIVRGEAKDRDEASEIMSFIRNTRPIPVIDQLQARRRAGSR